MPIFFRYRSLCWGSRALLDGIGQLIERTWHLGLVLSIFPNKDKTSLGHSVGELGAVALISVITQFTSSDSSRYVSSFRLLALSKSRDNASRIDGRPRINDETDTIESYRVLCLVQIASGERSRFVRTNKPLEAGGENEGASLA